MGIRIPLHLYLSPQPNSKLTEYCSNKTFPELCTKLTYEVAQIFVYISPSIDSFHFDDFHHTGLVGISGFANAYFEKYCYIWPRYEFIFCENGDNTVRLELEKDSKTQLTFTCSK